MPVKVQVPQKAPLVRILLSPPGKIFLALFVACIVVAITTFTYYYVKYSNLIEAKLKAGPFATTSMLLAAPEPVEVGEVTSPEQIAFQLRRAGYSESTANPMGHYTVSANEIDIYPGPDSYFRRENGVVKFSGDHIARIISLADNTDRTEYFLEPALISNLFDKNREKRRIVRYADIPPLLVHAVISAEDKRFFQHSGFDPLGIIRAAYVDLKDRRKDQGASTITQQLARDLWLNQKKTWRRKAAEVLVTLHLEQELSKQQIFEYYANNVDLGRRGSFDIRGFGEGAQVFFSKDIGRLTLPEAAMLAGLVQQPSRINPFRWPDRARARRNVVLQRMKENGYITQQQYQEAAATPLVLARQGSESNDSPYFMDLVNDKLLDDFQGRDFQTSPYRVYTTLDLDLQRDAVDAVRIGMQETDKLLARRKARAAKKGIIMPDPQCALIAIDPQTGEIKAFVGGRNYGVSQLDHVLAKRQPGSVFKPFVYATAMNTGLGGAPQVYTPATMLNDEPTTFWFDDKPYQPSNFENKYFGNVSIEDALAHSLNVATVQLAQDVGYGTVVDLARRAGMNLDIRPTPAVALGAYEVTPLEVAGAYTIFANHGQWVRPNFITTIRDTQGHDFFDYVPQKREVLDPRVAFVMVSMLEQVLQSGTAAGVHARGFNLPAAGKTGTSHDGWFAGFTSKLICIVWVGYDDNRELNLEGAHSALPVWTEFMKRAHQHIDYRGVTPFQPPAGVVGVQIDPASGQLATPLCPKTRTEYFIEGTQPVESCQMHGGGPTRFAGWDTLPPVGTPVPVPGKPGTLVIPVTPQPGQPGQQNPAVAQQQPPPNQQQDQKKHKGFFGKLKDIFK